MEFQQVLKSRRSVRAFSDDPVSDETVAALIEAATWAPSPLHLQPWSFVVVRGGEAKAKIKALCEQAKQAVIAADGPDWVKKYGFDFLDQAPVLIVVFSNPNKGGLGGYFNQPLGALQGSSAAVQNLMLAAAEQGLGSLWLTFFDPEALAAALGAPEGLEVAGVIPLGVPAGEVKAPPRKAPKVFSEAYGQE
ncbi:MAG: nitroreductase family protein [Desulfarculaceae bacterium]|nr:nitroreductase family protein [Desulfarculaceae bacterium]MCF8071338.1 nitroreductase family protein [Desulfarculaceae bacterium]MCF8101663.1 nitroreductase family protein [Desulfarculaceae bacterium]MCF8116728.1 nitroreductase family protein [Desulfarculaceae bacterium]